MKRDSLSLFLVSMAIIGLQIALMSLLSLAQWHHLASLVIGVALLGFGCSGTVLVIARRPLLAAREQWVTAFLLLSALSMALALPLAQAALGGFDAQLLLIDRTQSWRLLGTQLAFFMPMLWGALAIGLIFISRAERIGALYFANLLGSACGGGVALGLMWLCLPGRLPGLLAVLPLAAALIRGVSAQGGVRWLLPPVAAVVAFAALWPPQTAVSPYKPISYALSLPSARLTVQQVSPYGLLQQVEAPALRAAPELSLSFSGQVPPQPVLFTNGDTLGPGPSAQFDRAARLLEFSPRALPWSVVQPRRVLIPLAGTGIEARYAQLQGASEVIALQSHRAVPALMASSVPAAAGLNWVVSEARAYLAGDVAPFDLVLLPTIGHPGGDAGLSALSQDYLLTFEGLSALWHSLSPQGVISVSCRLDTPPRAPLRLAATLRATLEDAGIEQPESHLAAVRSWASITFLVSRRPLSAGQIEAIAKFSQDLQLDPLLPPALRPQAGQALHAMADSPLTPLLDAILRGDLESAAADYPFRLGPSTDDRPFFYQFLRWQGLALTQAQDSAGRLPILEIGYLLVVLSLVQLVATASVLIIGPLVWQALRRPHTGGRSPQRRAALATGVYFGGLGLGFMCFEIALLHQLVFYFGEPVFAAAGAMGLLLLCAGLGSWLSGRDSALSPGPRPASLAVTVTMSLVALALPGALSAGIALGPAGKLALIGTLVGPVALLMGMPFPAGLRQLSRQQPDWAPWAWGINGYLSVVATPLATLLALQAGFSRVLLLGILCYTCAALSAGALPGPRR